MLKVVTSVRLHVALEMLAISQLWNKKLSLSALENPVFPNKFNDSSVPSEALPSPTFTES